MAIFWHLKKVSFYVKKVKNLKALSRESPMHRFNHENEVKWNRLIQFSFSSSFNRCLLVEFIPMHCTLSRGISQWKFSLKFLQQIILQEKSLALLKTKFHLLSTLKHTVALPQNSPFRLFSVPPLAWWAHSCMCGWLIHRCYARERENE